MSNKILGAALAAAVSLAGFAQSASSAVVIDNSVTGTVTNDFSSIGATTVFPGTLTVPGATYGESFVGQTVTGGSGTNDTLSGSPAGPLTLQSNAVPLNNLAVLSLGSLTVVFGPSGNTNDAGGAVSILFNLGTDILRFNMVGTNSGGTFTVDFFDQSGTSIGSITQNTSDSALFGFRAMGGDLIAGVTITNTDLAGVGYDNIMFNQIPFPPVAISAPGALALFGLALAGIGFAARRKRRA